MWLFSEEEIANSPSFKDGIDKATESRYRREGVRFLTDVGTELKLSPHPTLATAAVYLQRFYMYHSFKEFSRHLTALACLFLAGKTEETPKKCRDLVLAAKEKLSEKHYLQAFGRGDKDPKEEVMSVERVLLQTIKFDLQLEHPYTFLLKYAKIIKADKEKTRSMVQMAWTFVNDSLCTTLCLHWEPEIIAIALMYLASRLSKVDIKDWVGREKGKKFGEAGNWWDVVVEDLEKKDLEDICHAVLDLYQTNPGSSSAAEKSAAGSSQTSTPQTPSNTNSPAQQPPISTPGAPVPQRPMVTNYYQPGPPAGPSFSGGVPIGARGLRPPPPLPPGPSGQNPGGQQVPVLGSATPVPLGAMPGMNVPVHPSPPPQPPTPVSINPPMTTHSPYIPPHGYAQHVQAPPPQGVYGQEGGYGYPPVPAHNHRYPPPPGMGQGRPPPAHQHGNNGRYGGYVQQNSYTEYNNDYDYDYNAGGGHY